MNKYIEKIAKLMSEENKQVGKTFATQTAAGVPAHIVGGVVGAKLGDKYLNSTSKHLARASNSVSHNLNRAGKVGRWAASKLHMDGAGGGKALGVGLGMAAVGGLADLASLKHTLKGKVKE